MKVGIIGSGGREHSICFSLNKSKKILNSIENTSAIIEIKKVSKKLKKEKKSENKTSYKVKDKKKKVKSKKIKRTLWKRRKKS